MLPSPRRASGILCAVLLASLTFSCSAGAGGTADEGEQQRTTPDAPAGTFGGTQDEWIVATVECLRDAGWDAQADFEQDGFEIPSFTFEQRDALMKAEADCARSVGELPDEPPMSAEEIGEQYDYFVEELIPCLTERGYQVDDPPSRDAFVEAYYSNDSWSPYLNVDPVTEDDWREINRECPQDPDDAH